MSIFIHGMEMPGQGEFSHVRIYGNGDVTVELSDGEEVIGHADAFDEHQLPEIWDVFEQLQNIEKASDAIADLVDALISEIGEGKGGNGKEAVL